MAWAERQYSKGEIDRAGEALIKLPKDDPARERAITVVDNWRSCHAYPLQIIKMTLFRRSRRVDPNALIAQRLKRRPSIEVKLNDNPTMKLSQMQDIGGCRAVLSTVSQVERLVKAYKKYNIKAPKQRSAWDGSDDFDYIKKPKEDGYRSVHLIFRFRSAARDKQIFNGQRIEIQIRSSLQHLWATAVETAQVFTGQALKSKIKRASDDWLRFFALVSSAFALREGTPPVPGTQHDKRQLVEELREINDRANVMETLSRWNDAIHLITEDRESADAYAFLLTLNAGSTQLLLSPAFSLNVKQFTKDELALAQKQYELAEKDAENQPNIQVVLVAVESLDALRKAYPNYYVDTRDFVKTVVKEIGIAPVKGIGIG